MREPITIFLSRLPLRFIANYLRKQKEVENVIYIGANEDSFIEFDMSGRKYVLDKFLGDCQIFDDGSGVSLAEKKKIISLGKRIEKNFFRVLLKGVV